ncbi:MAG: nucleotidyltransferase family protein, partial [Kiritimatiellia bacterium]
MRQAELRQCLIQDLCSKKKLSSPGFSPSHRELNALHPELVRFLPTWSARYPCAKGDATPRIRGVALQARCYQLRLFREVQTVMDALAKHEIAFAVCKGVSVMSLAGLAPGDRILHDVDLLLRERDAVWVVDYLRSQGWKERMGKAGDRLRISHHVDWVSPAGNRLNLQWALLGEELNPDRVDQALERRIPLNPGCGLKGQGLSLRDQLFQSVIAGQESWKGGSIRWIVDSCLLLREEEREVPWSEL